MATKRIRNDAWEVDHQYNRGSSSLNPTLDNSAITNNGDGTVTIDVTGHGFIAGSWVRIDGTTNYDGFYELLSVNANDVTITADFVAETPGGTETMDAAFQAPQGKECKIMEVRLHLSAAGGAAEAYTIYLDSAENIAFDSILDTIADMTLIQDDLTEWTDQNGFLDVGDGLVFTFANSNSRTWGLEIIYRLAA